MAVMGAPKHKRPATHASWCKCVYCLPPPGNCPCHRCRPVQQIKFFADERPSSRARMVEGGKTAPAAHAPKIEVPRAPAPRAPTEAERTAAHARRLMEAKEKADADPMNARLLKLMNDARAAGHPLTLGAALEQLERKPDDEERHD